MVEDVAVGLDLGGTNLKSGLVDRDGRLLRQRSCPTDLSEGPRTLIRQMMRELDALLEGQGLSREDVAGIGVGSPGPLSVSRGVIVKAANLPGWTNIPLGEWLRAEFDGPVLIENDANAATYGEFWKGAGSDVSSLVLLTLGTGIGGGVVHHGRILHGHFENAGELGHMIVEADGLPCTCGQRGCVEQYASASAVGRRAVRALKEGADSILAGAGAPDSHAVAQAAREGDSLCKSIWEEVCRYIALAAVNIQHAYNPELLLLGGGMSEAREFLVDEVNRQFRRCCWNLHDDYPRITTAALGNDAGVIGMAGLIWQSLEG